MYTLDDCKLQIIHPGNRNLDNGPDYLNAKIKIDNTYYHGDIEFHLNWQDWFNHGHQYDQRFNQVILHVLWHPPKNLPSCLDTRFAHFVISKYLSLSEEQWLKYMRENLNENKKMPLLLPKKYSPDIKSYKDLAWKRFLRKCEDIKMWVEQYGWENTVYIGLAKALGYSKNSYIFMDLVKHTTPQILFARISPLRRSPLLFWLILGIQGGLFENLCAPSEESQKKCHKYIDTIREKYISILPFSQCHLKDWNFSRLRPYNNPYYRLAGIAQILFEYQENMLFKSLLEIFKERKSLNILLKRLAEHLCIDISHSVTDFLQQLFFYKAIPQKTMGLERCGQYCLNILLPLFYIWSFRTQNTGFQYYIEDLYFTFPAIERNHFLRKFYLMAERKYPKFAYIEQAIMEGFV